MAKTLTTKPSTTAPAHPDSRKATAQPAAEGAHLDTSNGADEPGQSAADKAQDEADRKAGRAIREAIPQAQNPPEQPKMIPAKQIHSEVVQAFDPEEFTANRTPRKGIRVQAKALGYYDDKLRRVGDVFDIDAAETNGKITAFSSKWMRRVPPNTPQLATGSNAAIAAKHDLTQAERHGLPTDSLVDPDVEVAQPAL